MSLGIRRWCVAGLAMAGLAVGVLSCSSTAQSVGSLDRSGVGGSGAGGMGAGSCGLGGADPGGPSDGGDVPVGTPVDRFDCSLEGFVLNTFDEPSNLARPTNPPAVAPTLSFDATQGSPDPGSAQVTAPFSGANQYVDIQRFVNVPAPVDWSRTSLHVRVRVSQGTFSGSVEPYVITTGAYKFGGTRINFGPGSAWQEFRFDVSYPLTQDPGYDPTQVMLVGVLLNTGGAGAASTPVVFNIDTFILSP